MQHILVRLRNDMAVLTNHDWVTGKSSEPETRQNFLDCLNRTRPVTHKELILAELAEYMERNNRHKHPEARGLLRPLTLYFSPKNVSHFLGLKHYLVLKDDQFAFGKQVVPKGGRDSAGLMTPTDFKTLERRLGAGASHKKSGGGASHKKSGAGTAKKSDAPNKKSAGEEEQVPQESPVEDGDFLDKLMTRLTNYEMSDN